MDQFSGSIILCPPRRRRSHTALTGQSEESKEVLLGIPHDQMPDSPNDLKDDGSAVEEPGDIN